VDITTIESGTGLAGVAAKQAVETLQLLKMYSTDTGKESISADIETEIC